MRWRIGEGRAVGSFALLVTLLTSASPIWERELWRWSYVDGGIILLVALILVVTLVGLRAPATGPIDGGYRPRTSRIASHWIDLAWFLWGFGYLIGSAFLPASRGRFLQLDFFSSAVPGASFLEWSGGVALLVACGAGIWRSIARRSRAVAVLLLLPLAALGAGEGWARWEAITHPRPTAIPSLASERWDRQYVALNEQGFRDASHAEAKAVGTSRVLLVGDEAAFGIGIADTADRVSELLARRLSVASGRRWESLNAATVGTDTKDHVAILRDALRFAPDVVVLLYSFDDIAYFAPVARPDPLATPAHTWPQRLSPIRLLYVNSMLFQEGYLRARTRFPQLMGGGEPLVDPYTDPALVAAHLEEVQAFVRSAEGSGAAALVVPLDVEVGADPLRLIRYRRFVDAAAAADIPVLAVDSLFVGRALRPFVLDTLDRRPGPLVHRLVAEAVARRLIATLGLKTAAAAPPP
jgi:hypothetical protein